MTPDETLRLCRTARAMCPQQAFDEYTPDAWHLLLSDLDAEAALQALIALAKKQAFVSPAEIRAEATAIRTRHARVIEGSTRTLDMASVNVPHHLDPDDVAGYLAWLAATRHQVARGIQPPTHQLANPAPRPPGLQALTMKEIPDA